VKLSVLAANFYFILVNARMPNTIIVTSNKAIRGPNGEIINDKKRIGLKKGQDVTEAVWTEKDEK
jgi:hypothetical protein